MTSSLLIIGTEITRGIIEDKHTKVVTSSLSKIGIKVNEVVILPDDVSIEKVLKKLIENNDFVIVTGGLGPTSDDMTRFSISRASSLPLIKDEKAYQSIVDRVGEERAKGANERQTYIPQGFKLIENKNGTAPAFYGYIENTLLFALPGPPREMEPIFNSNVLPIISSLVGKEEEKRDEYSVFLTPEAKLDELCNEADSSLIWGTRFQDYKISLYVSGKTKEERDKAISYIQSKLGRYRINAGDKSALMLLVEKIKEKKYTLSYAESCTGGLASSLLTSMKGSSSFFTGSIVSYDTRIKKEILRVEEDIVSSFGVVSKETAFSMAEGVRGLMKTDLAASITGVAGPDKQENKEVGTVAFGFSSKLFSTSLSLKFSTYSRESIRRKAATASFLLLYALLAGENAEDISSSWAFL